MDIVTRVIAGLLALVALVLVAVRITVLVGAESAVGGVEFMPLLRLLLPLSVAVLFGYMAWSGRIPFVGGASDDSRPGR